MKQHIAAALLGMWLTQIGGFGSDLDLKGIWALARDGGPGVPGAQARAGADAQRLSQARAYRFPVLTWQGAWMRTDVPAEVFALSLNQGSFSMQGLMSGDPNHPKALSTWVNRLELVLPLYAGGQIGTRIRQARAVSDAGNRKLEWSRLDAGRKAVGMYLGLVMMREERTFLEGYLSLLASYRQQAEQMFGQGLLVQADVQRAQVEEAAVGDDLMELKARQKASLNTLAWLIHRENVREEDLAELPEIRWTPEPLAVWLNRARERPDLQAARLRLQAGQLEPRALRSSYLPQVALKVRGDMAGARLDGTHEKALALEIGLQWNLFAGGRDRAAVGAAMADFRAGAADVADAEGWVEQIVREARLSYLASCERRETAEKALKAAREGERVVRERFQQGLVRMVDLLDAATAVRNAHRRLWQVRVAQWNWALNLLVDAGQDLGQWLPRMQ